MGGCCGGGTVLSCSILGSGDDSYIFIFRDMVESAMDILYTVDAILD